MRAACNPGTSLTAWSFPFRVTVFKSRQSTPAAPPPMYARPFAIVGGPSMWISGPAAEKTHSRYPPSVGKQYRAAPSDWCIPAPNTILPSVTAGELTVGNFTKGPPLVHVGLTAFGSLGAMGKLKTVPSLKLPIAGNTVSDPTGTGEATKCSFVCNDQSTAGVAGPAMLSVFPVLRALPR